MAKDKTNMKLDAIRADIPWENKHLAQRVVAKIRIVNDMIHFDH